MKSNPIHGPDRKDHTVVPFCKNASGPIVHNTLTTKRYKPRFPFKNETSLSDFIVRGKLGAGAFGVVYRVEDKVTNQTMALKVMKKHGADDSDLEHSLAELDAMKRLMGDRHCMQLEAGFQDEQCLYLALVSDWPLRVWIDSQALLQAFYPGGDLHDLIGTYPRQCLPIDHARRYTAELVSILSIPVICDAIVCSDQQISSSVSIISTAKESFTGTSSRRTYSLTPKVTS
jgi:serine/threonine protein kinase